MRRITTGRLCYSSLCCALFAFGCGSESPQAELEDGEVAGIVEAVVSAGTAVTAGNLVESDTAMLIHEKAGEPVVQVTAYSAGHYAPWIVDADDERVVRTNASRMGWSVSLGGGDFVAYRMLPPPLWPVLWGQPSIGTMPATDYVYLVSLAVPKTKWPASGEASGVINQYLGGACIARSKNRGQTFTLKASDCVHDNYHQYEGSAIGGTVGDGVYAAFLDASDNEIDVWRAPSAEAPFAQISEPFPGKLIVSQPRVRTSGSVLYVAAADADGNLWLNSFSGTAWSGGVLVATGLVTNSVLQLSSGVEIATGSGFAFDVFTAESHTKKEARFFYSVRTPEGKVHLKGARCGFVGGTSCQEEAAWTTDSSTNSFNPAVKAVQLPTSSPYGRRVWKVSYQAEDSGEVSLHDANFTPLTFVSRQSTGPQKPCPSQLGSWGDYDDMQVQGSGTANAVFFRSFSDSSSGNCTNKLYTSSPLHVSQIALKPDIQ